MTNQMRIKVLSYRDRFENSETFLIDLIYETLERYLKGMSLMRLNFSRLQKD